jgi:predicted deacylase
MRDFVWVRAERGGFFRRSVVAGDHIVKNGVIGRMVDLWGEPLDEIVSPVDGVAIFTTTSPAIVDGGLLIGIGVPA